MLRQQLLLVMGKRNEDLLESLMGMTTFREEIEGSVEEIRARVLVVEVLDSDSRCTKWFSSCWQICMSTFETVRSDSSTQLGGW